MDELPYPLVLQRTLGQPAARGPLRRTVRSTDDLPRLAAHQVRVFRVGERYVEEHGQAGVRDETVLKASSVTVVDCRKRVEVVAELTVPSSGVGVFTVRVTFLCTVREPVVVVRDGVTDVRALLVGYVREIPGLNEEGAELPTTQAALVRRRVEARLAAFLEMRPLAVSGLEIQLSMVAVYSPEELQEHLREREQAELQRERDRFRYELEQERRESAQLQAMRDEQYRQQLDNIKNDYEQRLSSQQQQHDLTSRSRQNDFVRGETAQDMEQYRRDPVAAYTAAYHAGALNAADYADQLRLSQDRDVDRHRYDRDRQREDWRYQTEREDRFQEFELLRKRAELEAKRAEGTRQWELEFIQQQRRLDEDRQDRLSARDHELEWRQQVLQIQDSLLKLAISRGAGDELPVDIGELIRQIGELPATTTPAVGPTAAVTDILVEPTAESLDSGDRPDDAGYDDEDDYGEAGWEDGDGD